MRGRIPRKGIRENGPLKIRDADAAWNDAAKADRLETSEKQDLSAL